MNYAMRLFGWIVFFASASLCGLIGALILLGGG